MSWRDREYARGAWSFGGDWSPARHRWLIRGSIVTTLIVINIAAFALCTLTSRQSVAESPIFRWGAMSAPYVLHGQVWRLLTAEYLHWSFSHILMNMLGLYFLGHILERDWGPRKFLVIYTVAGLLGMIFYVILALIGWLPMRAVAAGASGCVLALLGACAVRYPGANVLIYFLFPIRIRTAALLFGIWYAVNLLNQGPNAGGDACHIAGLLFGAFWAKWGERWWYRTPSWRPVRTARLTPATSQTFAERIQQRRDDAETVDRILKKVYDGGVHTLSESEKRTLQEATERLRAMESGGPDRL